MYEVSRMRIKEQVDEKKTTIGTHRNAESIKKKTPLKITNILSIKNFEHISFWEVLWENQSGFFVCVFYWLIDRFIYYYFLQKKIWLFLKLCWPFKKGIGPVNKWNTIHSEDYCSEGMWHWLYYINIIYTPTWRLKIKAIIT
jgi:hypothetical protein